MMEKFAISSSLFSNVSSIIADVDDYNNDDDDDCDKRRKLRKVESNNSYSDSDIYGGASGDECTASSVFSDNLRFDDYLAKYRITFTDDVRSSSGSDSETDGDGGTHVVALLSSDEMESESVVEQKMANTAQKLHEIFVEGCCALYNDLQNAIEDVEGGRKRAATLDDQENKAAEDELINKNVQANGKENEEEVVVVVAELLDELSSRHCMLERQARQLADDWPKLADAAGTRIRTLTRAMQRLRCEVEQQKRRRNVNSNNFANAAAKGTTAVSVTSMMIPSAAAHFRRWLYTSERRLDALKEAVSISVATFNNNYFAQLQKPEFCCSNESNNKLLSTLQRFRTEHQALQLQIESDGRALLNAAYQQLCAESNNNKNCGGESATGKRTVDRWRRNVEALKNRWHAHWLASLELRQRLDEHIDRLTDRSGRTSATLSRYASDEDGDEDTDSSAGREPLCKRLRRSCGHNSLHNHSQQLLSLALESPLPLDDQQSPHAADDVAAAVATKLKKSDAQSVASYSSGIETASSSMPSAGGVCRCHHQQRGKMVPCNSESSRAPSSAFPCEEAVGLSSAASTSAPDIGYSSGENNSVVSEELPSANLNKKSQPAENQVVEKLLSDVENEGASEAAGADVVLSEEGGKPDDFAVASALLTRSYYKMVPLDDAGVTDTELTGGIPRFLFNSSATPPPSGVTTGDSNPHLTDSVIVHIDNCCCGGGGLPRQQQHQQHLSTERSGDDVDRDASIVGDDFAEVMGIMDEQFNAHLQRLRQHGTQWRELRSVKPATADVATATATVAACAASSDNTVRRVSSVIGGRVGGSAVDKASCDASSEDEDAVAAVAAFDVVATSPPQRSANSSGSLQRRRKRFHRRSAQNVTVNNNMALQPPPLFGGDMFVASHSTALTLRLANVLMDQSVYITGHSSDEETNNNNTNSNGNNNGEDFTPTPPKQSMMSRSWLGADAASGGSASLRRSPLSVMSRSAMLDGEKLPLTAFRRRRRALRRRTTNGFTSTSRALQNSFLRLAQEQRAEEEISNANLPLPPHLPSNNNNNGGQPQLMFNNNQYYYHYYHHYYDNVKVDLREANVSHPLSSHQNNHHCRHHSASYHAVRYRRRQASIASTHSSSSSSSSNASTHPEESGDAHYEWDDYRDPCDLLMPPSCIHLDRELNNNNNNTGEHQRKECPQDNELPNNNCAETTTSSVIDCRFVNYARKPSFAVSQQLVPPTLIDDDDFGVELPELLFVDDSTKGSGNSSLSDDAEEPKNSASDFPALFAVVRRVERMLRDSDVALNSVENMLRRCGKRNNNKQQVEEDVKFIQATARENLKKLADAAMHLDSSSTNSVNGEQLVELDALHQRWSRLVARLERHNRRQQQKQHFKNNNNANESNSCSDGNSGSEKGESGNANDGRRSTMVSISLHAILEDMKAQLHLLVLSDLTYHSPIRLAEVEEVVATRKEILHTLLTYRDDLRELAAGAAASVSLSAQSSAKPSAAEGDDALELWALVDLVETSLHNIERSTLALERLRTDFGALCAAFRHLEAKIDRLLTDSADDGVTDESRKSIERELELCQERMNALETACNTLSGQLAVISPPPHASTYLIANDEITEEEAEDNEEAPPDEPSPPFGAAMFADELTRFRDELSRLTLRFQSAFSVTSHHCQISNREIDSEKEGKFDSTITPTSAATATSQNNQPQSKASITNTIATVNRKRRLNNQSHRFFAAKFTQTTDAIVKVQSVGTQSAISAETFRDYAERIAARKTAKRRTAASCATPNVTNGGATMSGGSPAMPNREDKRKTTLEVDVTTVTVLRRRGSIVKNGCRTAANISSTTQLPQRLRAALRDSRLAQFCLGCAIAAALGLLLLTIMAATGTDERNPLLANNYRWTFGPQLTYMQGPPPV